MTPQHSALLRAEGSVPASDVAGTDLAADAAAVGRRLVRAGPDVRLGWADGHEPHPDGAPTARLSAFPTGLLAAALALAWPDAAADPYPGEPLPADAVESLSAILDRSPNVVTKYLAELRAAEFITDGDDGRLRLGPAVATWTPSAVNALRRHHHLLSASLSGLR